MILFKKSPCLRPPSLKRGKSMVFFIKKRPVILADLVVHLDFCENQCIPWFHTLYCLYILRLIFLGRVWYLYVFLQSTNSNLSYLGYGLCMHSIVHTDVLDVHLNFAYPCYLLSFLLCFLTYLSNYTFIVKSQVKKQFVCLLLFWNLFFIELFVLLYK